MQTTADRKRRNLFVQLIAVSLRKTRGSFLIEMELLYLSQVKWETRG